MTGLPKGLALLLPVVIEIPSGYAWRLRADHAGGNATAAAYDSRGGLAGIAGPPPAGPESFASFVQIHGRQYQPGSAEYLRRQSLFEKRKREADEQNGRPRRLWTAAVNSMADWTEGELRALRGSRPGGSGRDSGGAGTARASTMLAAKNRRSGKIGPSQDWRRLESLQRIKDQGTCGSCWAIAAATLVEAYAQKADPATAETPSVQQIVACTPNPKKCGGDGGCRGATMDLALDYAFSHGISSDAQWPYAPHEITSPPGLAPECPQSTATGLAQALANTSAAGNRSASRDGVVIPFSEYEVLPRNEYTGLLQALYENGPVGVSVAASGWYSYYTGIYDGCTGPSGAIVDHAVVAVAYGEQSGVKYWTLMNSWGFGWGEGGYMRLLRRDDDASRCAINGAPERGTACVPYPAQETVCGMCGVLFESVAPRV